MTPSCSNLYLKMIFFFLCGILTFIAAEETNMDYCVYVMKHYCQTYDKGKDPTAFECVKAAVDSWSRDSMPEGIINDYYEGFAGNPETLTSISRNVWTREEFCSEPHITDSDGCKRTLSAFKDTKESTVDYALYSITMNDLYTTFQDADGTTIDMMKDGVIPDPVEYCTQRCAGLSSLLDWTPYLALVKTMKY